MGSLITPPSPEQEKALGIRQPEYVETAIAEDVSPHVISKLTAPPRDRELGIADPATEEPSRELSEEQWETNLIQLESGGKPGAAADSSTAKGLYQFTEFWYPLIEKKFGRSIDSFLPRDNTPEERDRSIRDQKEVLWPWYRQQHLLPGVARIKQALPDEANRYPDHALKSLVHFLGEPTAAKYLKGEIDKAPGINVPIDEYLRRTLNGVPSFDDSQTPVEQFSTAPKKVPPGPDDAVERAVKEAKDRFGTEAESFNIMGMELHADTYRMPDSLDKHLQDKYGVSQDFVNKYTNLSGIKTEGQKDLSLEDGARLLLGYGSNATLNLPLKAAIAIEREAGLVSDTELQAIEDIRNYSRQARGLGQEIVTGIVGAMASGGGSLAVKIAQINGRLAKAGAASGLAATTGGLLGLGESEEGKELERMAESALLAIPFALVPQVIPTSVFKKGAKKLGNRITDAIVDITGAIDQDTYRVVEDQISKNTDGLAFLRNFIGNRKLEASSLDLQEALSLPDRVVQQLTAGIKPSTTKRLLTSVISEETSADGVLLRDLIPDLWLTSKGGTTKAVKSRINQLAKDVAAPGAMAGDEIRIIKALLAQNRVNQTVKQFARTISPKRPKTVAEAFDIVRDFRSQNKEFFKEAFDNYRKSKAIVRHLEKKVDKSEFWGNEQGSFRQWRRKAKDFFIDNRYVYSAMDRKFGTRIEPILDEVSNAVNLTTIQTARVGQAASRMGKSLRKAGIDGREVVEKARQGSASFTTWLHTLDVDQQAAAKSVIQVFRNEMDTVNELARKKMGITGNLIEAIKSGPYVPNYLIDTADLVFAMKNKLKSVEATSGQLGRMKDREIGSWLRKNAKLNNEEGELIRAVSIFVDGDGPVTTGAKFREGLAKSLSVTDASNAINSRSASLIKRTGNMPDFLLEKDPTKLLYKYGQAMHRHVHLAPHLDKMKSVGSALVELGAVGEGRYILNNIADVLGTRGGTVNRAISDGVARAKLHLKSKQQEALKDGKKLTAKYYQGLSDLPDYIHMGAANFYPFYLGLRPDAVLRNLTQPFLLTAPELGGSVDRAYGHRLVVKSMARVYRKALMGKNPYRELGELGFAPAKFSGEGMEALRKGLLQDPGMVNAVKRGGNKTLDKMQDISMAMYSWSDLQNRAVTLDMSRNIAKDLQRGLNAISGGARADKASLAAIEFVKNASGAYRRDIKDALKSGNWDRASQKISNYLLSKTQFNYNRASMSEYGRFMGGFFSQFSKWPTSLVGNVVDLSARKAAGEIDPSYKRWNQFQMYAGPLMAGLAAEGLFLEDLRKDNPVLEKIIGRNMAMNTPGAALIGTFTGKGPGVPPVLSKPLQAIAQASSGDYDKAANSFLDSGLSMMKGGILWKLFADYIPEWQGEDPVRVLNMLKED